MSTDSGFTHFSLYFTYIINVSEENIRSCGILKLAEYFLEVNDVEYLLYVIFGSVGPSVRVGQLERVR